MIWYACSVLETLCWKKEISWMSIFSIHAPLHAEHSVNKNTIIIVVEKFSSHTKWECNMEMEDVKEIYFGNVIGTTQQLHNILRDK